MFKPGDRLNPYDPASQDHSTDEGVLERLEAGTSPMTSGLAEKLKDPKEMKDMMDMFMQMMKDDAAERERTGETPQEQRMREKLEWAAADAKSAELKVQGNDAFRSGEYKTAYVIYTACISLSAHEPLYWLNRAAVALKLRLYSEAAEDASSAIERGDFNRAKAHFRRGQALFFLGNWDKATQEYETALKIQPGDPSVVEQTTELKRVRDLSPDEQAAWISAKGAVSLQHIFEPGELERLVQETTGTRVQP